MKIDRDQVIKVLEQRKAGKPCHSCGNGSFELLDKFSNILIKDEIDGSLVIGGPTIPAAVVICNNCGAITFHALGALGLLGGGE